MQGRGQVGQGCVVTRSGGHTGTLDLSLLLITGLVTLGYLILNESKMKCDEKTEDLFNVHTLTFWLRGESSVL